MRPILTALLVLMLSVTVMAKQPIGFKHWQLDNDTTFAKQIGGAVRNYQKSDKTWDSIVNGFELEGDSVVFVEKSVLRSRINKNGVSKVMLTWNDQEYTITQKLLGIGWIKISTRQSQWIDSTMDWSNFSVDSNICKWTGISPAVDYRVLKDNGRVAHGIFYKPAFLDSAVTLYNQRPDSLDIALANVMIYTLSANIDDADSAIGDVPWRKLKNFGDYSFNLGKQRLRFPGSDTLPQVPVRQYWERRDTKIICIEYVMMSKIKQVHEAYPSATIWHNDSKTIDGEANVEDAYIYISSPDNNYGGNDAIIHYAGYREILIRVKNVASELGGGATISAAVCSVYCYNHGSSSAISAYSVFKPWIEGEYTGDNGDSGVTYNDWAADADEWGTEGCLCARDAGVDNSNDDGACTDANADRKATAEGTETVDAEDTWFGWEVSSALAQAWYDGTKNEEGIFLSGGAATFNYFTSTEWVTTQPFWVFTYTANRFGADNEGGFTSSIRDVIWANRSSPTSSGTLDGMAAWLTVTTASHNVKGVVYLWSDKSFVDSTEIIDVPIGEGWVFFEFVNNANITASTEYAIAIVAEANGGDCKVDFDLSGGSHAIQSPFTYGVWLANWTTVSDSGSYEVSIYAFYTPAEEEAAGQIIMIH